MSQDPLRHYIFGLWWIKSKQGRLGFSAVELLIGMLACSSTSISSLVEVPVEL